MDNHFSLPFTATQPLDIDTKFQYSPQENWGRRATEIQQDAE
jgi:hypothetical protein